MAELHSSATLCVSALGQLKKTGQTPATELTRCTSELVAGDHTYVLVTDAVERAAA